MDDDKEDDEDDDEEDDEDEDKEDDEDDTDLDVIHDERDPAAEDEHPGADHGGGVEGAGQGGDTGQLGLAPGHRVWWGVGWSY